ncbi:hypothetical protein [Budvicia diplopodorum]|uniref:hypothetical protein n=1 Tax=Budvicia diplopodorum TaxID=1119056 RepID=UPI00135C6364|nr:hypothetical protein [Budvicia diplopodorum]
MKPLLFIATLLMVSAGAGAQEQFVDPITNVESLFLGSVHDDQVKVLEYNNILLKDKSSLVQNGALSGKQFINRVFSRRLHFEMEGHEPLWQAKLTKNGLVFIGPDKQQRYQTTIYINEKDTGGAYYFTFRSHKDNVFGVVNYLGLRSENQRMCEYNIGDSDSLYEVYLEINGRNYRGCATLNNQETESPVKP